MSCINPEAIQIYIDGEATKMQIAIIEKHLAGCEQCTAKINHQRRLALAVKNAVHLLNDAPVQIPHLVKQPQPVKKHIITIKQFIYSLAAACILLFVIISISRREPLNQNPLTIVSASEWEVDANRPISEQQLILNVVDKEGNVTEYLIR